MHWSETGNDNHKEAATGGKGDVLTAINYCEIENKCTLVGCYTTFRFVSLLHELKILILFLFSPEDGLGHGKESQFSKK